MEQLSLMLKVLWAPSEATQDAVKKPIIVLPLALLFVASLITTAVTFYKLDPGDLAIRTYNQAGITLSPDQKQQIIQSVHQAGPMALGFFSSALRPVTLIIGVSIIYFLIFTLLGREGCFRAFVSVTALAFVPTLFMYAISIVSLFVLPKASIVPEGLGVLGPAMFVDPNSVSRPMFIGLTMLDAVTIWILVLLAIGYRPLLRRNVPAAVRIAAVIVPWIAYCGLRVGFAVVTGF